MSWQSDVRERFDAHKQVRNGLVDIARSDEEGWKTRYGRIRQDLRATLDELVRTIETARRSPSDPQVEEVHAAVTAYGRLLDSHHSRWPILIIKDRGSDYQESMKKVDASFHELKRAIAKIQD